MRTQPVPMFVFLKQKVSQWIVTPLGCHIHKCNASITLQYSQGFRLTVPQTGVVRGRSNTSAPGSKVKQIPKSLIWSRFPSERNKAPNRTHMHHDQQLSNHMHLIGNQNQSRFFFFFFFRSATFSQMSPFLCRRSCLALSLHSPKSGQWAQQACWHVSRTAWEDFWFQQLTPRETQTFSQEMTGEERNSSEEGV